MSGLRSGRIPDFDQREGEDDGLLLRHILGALDEDYIRQLRLRHSLNRLGDAALQGRLAHYLRRKIRPDSRLGDHLSMLKSAVLGKLGVSRRRKADGASDRPSE